MYHEINRSVKFVALIGAYFISLVSSGCLRGEPEAPLNVERPIIELGIIRGTYHYIRQPFKVRVWDRGPVRIASVKTTCCGAGPVEPDITGQELPAGSTHVLFLRMDRGAVGPWTITANIMTDPPSPRPISMTLSAVLSGIPIVSPERLEVEQDAGAPTSAMLHVSLLRTHDEAMLELNEKACDFSPFILKEVERRTEIVPDAPDQSDPPQWDQLTLQLEQEEKLAAGEHRFNLNIALRNGLELQPVPARIVVPHPCRPSVPRVFFGELESGSVSERTIPLIRSGHASTGIASVTSDTDFVRGTTNSSGDALVIRVAAPQRVGRFKSILTLGFVDPTIPRSTVTVTGIVKGS